MVVPRRAARGALTLVLATSVLASGCGILFTTGRPAVLTPQAPPDCTTSKKAVYADTVIMATAMGTSLFLGLGAIAKEGDLAEGETNRLAYATLFTFLGGVAFSVSGIVGGVRVRGCRKAHDEWRAGRMMYGPPGAPYPAPPGAQYPAPPYPAPPGPAPAPAPAPAPGPSVAP